MPLKDFKCKQCNKIEEHLVKAETASTICSSCGANTYSLVSMPAKTARRWGDTNLGYDYNLKRSFSSISEKDKYLEANNLVPISEFKGDFLETTMNKVDDKNNLYEAVSKKVEEIKAETGDINRAYAEAYSIDTMKKLGTYKE